MVFLPVHTTQTFFCFHSIAVLYGNMKLGMVRIEKGVLVDRLVIGGAMCFFCLAREFGRMGKLLMR